MAFDPDFDLTESFNEVVSGKKKSKKSEKSVSDFDFSRENAATLDLGAGETISKDPIEEGHKRITGNSKRRKN